MYSYFYSYSYSYSYFNNKKFNRPVYYCINFKYYIFLNYNLRI